MGKYNTAPSAFEKVRASLSSYGIVGKKLIEPGYGSLSEVNYLDIEIICDKALLEADYTNIRPVFSDKLKAIGKNAFGPNLRKVELHGPVPEIDPHAFDSVKSDRFALEVEARYLDDYLQLAQQMGWTFRVYNPEVEDAEYRRAESIRAAQKKAKKEAEQQSRKDARFTGSITITLKGDRGPVLWIEALRWEQPFVFFASDANMEISFTPDDPFELSKEFSIEPDMNNLVVNIDDIRSLYETDDIFEGPTCRRWRVPSSAEDFYIDALREIVDYNSEKDLQDELLTKLILHRRHNRSLSLRNDNDYLPARVCILRADDEIRLTFPSVEIAGKDYTDLRRLHMFDFDSNKFDGDYGYPLAIIDNFTCSRYICIADIIAFREHFLPVQDVTINTPDDKKLVLVEYYEDVHFDYIKYKDYLTAAQSWVSNREDLIFALDNDRPIDESLEYRQHPGEEPEDEGPTNIIDYIKSLNDDEDDEDEEEEENNTGSRSELIDYIKSLQNDEEDEESEEESEEEKEESEEVDNDESEEDEDEESEEEVEEEEESADEEEESDEENHRNAIPFEEVKDAGLAAACVVRLPLTEEAMAAHSAYLGESGFWVGLIHNDADPSVDYVHSVGTQTMASALRRLPLSKFKGWRQAGGTEIYLTPRTHLLSERDSSIKGKAVTVNAMQGMLGTMAESKKDKYDKKTLVRFFIHTPDGAMTVRDTLIDGDRVVADIPTEYFDRLVADVDSANGILVELQKSPL